MPSEDEILACYSWATGTCFRCARLDVATTRMAWIIPRSGEAYDVRACQHCVLDLEAARRRLAARRGEEYEPGRLGGDTS